MLKYPPTWFGAAAIITNEYGAVLLVHHTYGQLNWEIPGGGGEAGESAAETAVREVHEETGLTVANAALAGVYYEPLKDMHHFTFRCQLVDHQEPHADQAEVSECGFWPTNDLPRPITDFTIRRIKDALDPHDRPVLNVIGPRQLLR